MDKPNITYIRTITNENIIGILQQEDSIEIVLSKPLQVIVEMDPNGEAALVFFPWIPFSLLDNDRVTIGRDKIMFSTPIAEEIHDLVNKYIERCYSGSIKRKFYDPYERAKIAQQSNSQTNLTVANTSTNAAPTISDLEQLLNFRFSDPKKPS